MHDECGDDDSDVDVATMEHDAAAAGSDVLRTPCGRCNR